MHATATGLHSTAVSASQPASQIARSSGRDVNAPSSVPYVTYAPPELKLSQPPSDWLNQYKGSECRHIFYYGSEAKRWAPRYHDSLGRRGCSNILSHVTETTDEAMQREARSLSGLGRQLSDCEVSYCKFVAKDALESEARPSKTELERVKWALESPGQVSRPCAS